ncbi:MAG: FKBP-type peptidyl-prolyl cis-trans isomerase [Planctomycetes bacterium]|nr:FKBP-type peptidyl-prolyl cis-trans isomerase [Planctomycetota bacterium]
MAHDEHHDHDHDAHGGAPTDPHAHGHEHGHGGGLLTWPVVFIAGVIIGLAMIAGGGCQAEPKDAKIADNGAPAATPAAATAPTAAPERVNLAGPVPTGYTDTTSGIRYRVVRAGNGPKPKATDEVFCHYKGWFEGKEKTPFDSCERPSKPVNFPVTGVIRGWTEMLLDMRVGEKRYVVIPWRLAYGADGDGREIPPRTDLQFEMELVAIK